MGMWFLLFTGFAIGMSGAIIPGPLTLFTISETLKSKRFAGLTIITGHIIIEFLIIIIIFLGLHRLLSYRPVLATVSALGGVSFVAMGAMLFFRAGKMTLSGLDTKTEFDKGLVIGGIFFSIASPGFIIWWATIGVSTVVRASLLGIGGIIALIIGHWLADIAWYAFLSYAVERGKLFLTDKVYRHCIRILSLLLVLLGAHFLLMAFRY